MNLDIFKPIISLINKIVPDGSKKMEVLLAIEEARSRLKQPLALSILSLSVYYVFAVKSILYRLKMIVYFNTTEWWTDVVLVSIVFAFQFGIPFKYIIKAITDFINEKRGK